VVTIDQTGDVDHRTDARAPNGAARAAVAAADFVVLALPDAVARDSLGWLAGTAHDAAVIVSACSVQRPLFAGRATIGMRQLLLGINPMFSPTLPVAGRPVALVAREPCDAITLLHDRLTAAAMTAVVVTPEEHDTAMSYLQVLPHAAVLSFIGALAQAPVDVDTLMTLAPPPARTLIALACRILAAPPDLYWEIQHANPAAAPRRDELRAALVRLDSIAAVGRSEDFRAALMAAADWLDPHLAVGAEECKRLFQYHRAQP
jgi:prephenate dehydrogenase